MSTDTGAWVAWVWIAAIIGILALLLAREDEIGGWWLASLALVSAGLAVCSSLADAHYRRLRQRDGKEDDE